MTNVTDTLSQEPFVLYREFLILQSFIYNVWVCILLFGFVANAINITVFVKIGFRDNVTVSLLFLSLSDLMSLVLSSLTVANWFVGQHWPNHEWPFHRYIHVAFYWYSQVFYDYSSFISVFLGLVRCACVAKPLLFKSMFTVTRTLIILGVLFLVALSLRIPVLTSFRLTWAPKPQTNSTWLAYRASSNSRKMFAILDIVNRNVVSWVAYTITVICVIILVIKLVAASRFRQSLAAQTRGPTYKQKTVPPSKENSTPQSDAVNSAKESSNQDKKISNKLSAKDVQVIQSVTLICAIFIFSQLPFQFNSTNRLVDPEVAHGRRKRYVYEFGTQIAITCSYINSSINILVHYHFNSRYRETLLSLLPKKCAKVSV
ncbi:chemosensory receptor C [Elysia marginata]|uniref:Chemosensory receptor C n=1 Tax=Elysia marginata TaxID=1093978 RepID=A0AAV4FD74_9GAST|nr:chemosensory receptor C [Elysia marginata]